jgi:predicted ATPase
MTSDEILLAFGEFAWKQLDVFIPIIIPNEKSKNAISITTMESDLILSLENKKNELIENADNGVLLDVLQHNISQIMQDVISEFREHYKNQ